MDNYPDTGGVTASLFISKLQARPQQNMLTRVLQKMED